MKVNIFVEEKKIKSVEVSALPPKHGAIIMGGVKYRIVGITFDIDINEININTI